MKIVIERATESKLKRTKWVSNGHDCWGNSEGYDEDYVIVNGKSERVFDSEYIIHNEKEVLEVGYIDTLPDNLRQYLDKDLYDKIKAEEKERRYKRYLQLKEEFDNDPVYIRDQKLDKLVE